jgi:hypothetical protein
MDSGVPPDAVVDVDRSAGAGADDADLAEPAAALSHDLPRSTQLGVVARHQDASDELAADGEDDADVVRGSNGLSFGSTFTSK